MTRAPADLTPRGRGRKFWVAIDKQYDLSPGELELLTEVCRLLDEIEGLNKAIATGGVTTLGSRQQRRVNPALTALQQARGELRRLLDALQIPNEVAGAEGIVVEGVVSLTSRRAQKAARARWADRGASHAP